MRVCLDTNVLVSGIFWAGVPGAIVEQWIADSFDLLISVPILDEYKIILHRLADRVDGLLAEHWIRLIIQKSHIVAVPAVNKPWSRDNTDDKFMHCCFTGNADYLVTGDKDLLVLAETDLPFTILKPKAFLTQIQ